jgi:sec-independent protein translocase protein TatC
MEQEPERKDNLLPDEEEEFGGPVKSFLEHLEDLRWVIIKVVVAVMLGMVISLIAANHLVSFLVWPLHNADVGAGFGNRPLPMVLGTNSIARLPREQAAELFGTNRLSAVRLVPHLDGTNYVLRLQPVAESPTNHFSFNGVTLKNFSPVEPFFIALKVALYGGIVISAPFVIYFIGGFLLPALRIHEKKLLFQIVGFGSFLFFLGVAFCYFIIMQVALLATVQFSQWLGFEADQWRADAYIGFVCKFMLGMGISFQVPVVLLTMVKVGVMDYRKLSQFRTYWIVINLVLCAFMTPSGDPVTMLVMAIPLQVLYELSVLIARYWAKQDAVKAGSESAVDEL